MNLTDHNIHSSCFQVILPGDVSNAEVGGASAVSKAFQVGGALNQSDVWLLLWEDGVSIHPINRNTQQPMSFKLSMLHHHGNTNLRHSGMKLCLVLLDISEHKNTKTEIK